MHKICTYICICFGFSAVIELIPILQFAPFSCEAQKKPCQHHAHLRRAKDFKVSIFEVRSRQPACGEPHGSLAKCYNDTS